jgi:transcriptional antiterminator RfaH
MEGVEVLYPRMQFKRKWRRTTREFTEPLFPNYVFARFNPRVALARVRHAYGVQTVVHFGSRPVIVPEATIEEIRKNLGAEQVCQVKTVLAPGDAVTIRHGAFSGLQAVIKNHLPRKQRVQLLLEFLGRQTNIEVDEGELAKEYPHPLKKFL